MGCGQIEGYGSKYWSNSQIRVYRIGAFRFLVHGQQWWYSCRGGDLGLMVDGGCRREIGKGGD